ncbi:MAG: phosphate ABC transporter permease family protein, partial [Geminicoccaceae bacterium]
MPPAVAVVLILAIAAYFLANRRALAIAGGRSAALHSRPGYYASYAALLAAGPAIALWAAWRLIEPVVLRGIVLRSVPPEITTQSPERVGFFMSAVRRLAEGLPPVGEVTPAIQAAAEYYATLLTFSRIALLVACAALAVFCVTAGLRNVQREFRARNVVERWCTLALWLAAGLSVATTAGIVFSVLFESIRFFGKVPIIEF